jgi:hypothetical protein
MGAALLTVAAVGFAAPFQAQSQERTAFNAIYVELGGNGLWYSMNYERLVQDFSLRVGASFMSVSASAGTSSASVSSFGIPLTASYLGIGGQNHKLEVGAGILFERFSGQASSGFGQNATGGGFYPMATFVFGYRYAPAGGGFNFKLAFTPVYHPDLGTFPWGGMSFGYGF